MINRTLCWGGRDYGGAGARGIREMKIHGVNVLCLPVNGDHKEFGASYI